MKYINSIYFPCNETLVNYMNGHSYQDWPFNVFVDRGLNTLFLEDITILYGNNGSGKSTILSCLGEKLKASRCKPIFKEEKRMERNYYKPLDDYLEHVRVNINLDPETGYPFLLPSNIKLITSEDIFKKIEERSKNNHVYSYERAEVESEYDYYRHSRYDFHTPETEEEFSKRKQARRMSKNEYVNGHSRKPIKMLSNGETSIENFNDLIVPDGIYLLDEPENCLSPVFQLELMKMISDARRFFNCQFIIATHSPLILSLTDAVVYDLDENPITSKSWCELENVKTYFNFFYNNKDKFIK